MCPVCGVVALLYRAVLLSFRRLRVGGGRPEAAAANWRLPPRVT